MRGVARLLSLGGVLALVCGLVFSPKAMAIAPSAWATPQPFVESRAYDPCLKKKPVWRKPLASTRPKAHAKPAWHKTLAPKAHAWKPRVAFHKPAPLWVPAPHAKPRPKPALKPAWHTAPQVHLETHGAALNTGNAGNAGNVYNLVFPMMGSQAIAGQHLLIRLNNSASGNQVEVSLGASPGPAAVTPPEPAATPQPWSTPAPLPTPMPTPTPATVQVFVPAPASSPYRELGASTGAEFLSESYPEGADSLDIGLVPVYSLIGRYELDSKWALESYFRYLAYTITDQQVSASQHHRDVFEGALGAAYHLSGLPAEIEAGLWAKQVSVANNWPPSLTTPFISATSQLFLAPRVALQSHMALSPNLGLEAEIAALPYVLAFGDESVSAISPLFGLGLDPALSYAPTDWLTFSLAYHLELLKGYGSDFLQLAHGPMLGLDWRF